MSIDLLEVIGLGVIVAIAIGLALWDHYSLTKEERQDAQEDGDE